jgi:hypothetical protein
VPEPFIGKYSEVVDFVHDYKGLFTKYNILTNEQKCKNILRYCKTHTKDLILALDSYFDKDWTMLRADLLDQFDAEYKQYCYSKDNLKKWQHK